MARTARRNRHRAAKAAPAPGTVSFSPQQLSAVLAAQQQLASGNMTARPLPSSPLWETAPFGPGRRLPPAPINTVRPDTGRAEPRLWEFPVSWNLQIDDRWHVPWRTLQAAADMPLFRKCIERRKSVCGLDFSVIVDPKAVAREAAIAGQAAKDVESALRKQYMTEISRVSDWLAEPDRKNGYDWQAWTSLLMENRLKFDATVIYPRKTYGGDLYALEVIDGKCYSDDTEVLTRHNGWVRFADVQPDDEFATRNQKTQAFEWQAATYFHRERHAGQMIRFHSKCLDLLVTPNHRMLVTSLPRPLGGSRHRSGEAIVPAAQLAELGNGISSKIPVTCQWEGTEIGAFALESNGRTTSMGLNCSGDDFAAFMGMWLAEGSLGSTDQVVISQVPQSKGYRPYRELLARIFGRDVCHTGTNFVIGRKVLHDYLAEFGKAHTKYVPEVIKDASPRQLAIFWRYYMLGDGCYSGGRERIATVSKRMAGDLQEIAQKMGYCASVRPYVSRGSVLNGREIPSGLCWIVRLSRTAARTWTASTEDYDGEVFCVSVPNEVLYVRRNGYAAWCGNTIKPLLDEYGGRPAPPLPAFQQIMYGFPRGEFIADADVGADGKPYVPGGYASDELTYERSIIRSESPYGMSATEIALLDGLVWMRRMGWILAEYTEGVTPGGFLETSDVVDWNPEQWQDWQRALNDHLGGNTEERMKWPLGPPGTKLVQPQEVAERYKPDYDLFLIKLVAGDFGLPASEVGFTETGALGASFHEGEEDILNRQTRIPDSNWISKIATKLAVRQLGMPNVLKVQILGLESEDEAAADAVAQEQVNGARLTINEDRARRGQPPYSFDEADMPMLMTTRGVVFLEGASKTAPPGTLVGPAVAPPAGAPMAGGPDAQGDTSQPDGQDEEDGQDGAPSKQAEKAALRRYLAKNRGRPFECRALVAADMPELDGDPRVVFKDAGPKALAGTGPAGRGTGNW